MKNYDHMVSPIYTAGSEYSFYILKQTDGKHWIPKTSVHISVIVSKQKDRK